MSASEINLEAALAYAKRVWAVFPCHYMTGGRCSCGKECKSPGKHPRTSDGFKSATTDPEQIRDWWGRCPAANIGIRTGEASGVWVLDLDGPEGIKAFTLLEAKHGPTPKTPTVNTGGGGRHLYFEWLQAVEIKSRTKVAGLPIDVRGTGGYVIAPPSNHRSGNLYEWVDNSAEMPLAAAPQWLTELVTSRAPSVDPQEALFAQVTDPLDLRTAPGAPHGCRHDQACRLIGAALGRGENPITVLKLAFEWGNRCSPPLEQDEILRIVSDITEKDADKLESDVAATEVAPWPELAPAALYGLGGDIVRAIEPHTEADLVSILVQLLVCFGNLIGRSAFFLVEGTKHFCNLFAVLVGETAKGRKGTSLDRVMELIRWIDELWLKSCVLGGLSSGEGLIYHVRDAYQKDEPIKEGGKVTGYQKVIADHGVADKRLLIAESEFASVLRIAKREGNTLSQLMRQAWDSGTLRTLTKNSPLRATNAHISLVGHVTAEELLRSLAAVEAFSGFANRFLWLCVRRSKLLPEGGGAVDLRPLIDRLSKAVEYARGVGQMTRNEAGRELWDKMYREMGRRGLGGVFGAATDRAEAQVLRLSMVYALLDMKATIEPAHLEAAMALWQYAEDSARWIFGTSTGDPLADKILAIIREKPVTTKEIHDLTNRHYKAGQIKHALNKLLRQKLIRREQDRSTGGRPADRWYPAE